MHCNDLGVVTVPHCLKYCFKQLIVVQNLIGLPQHTVGNKILTRLRVLMDVYVTADARTRHPMHSDTLISIPVAVLDMVQAYANTMFRGEKREKGTVVCDASDMWAVTA